MKIRKYSYNYKPIQLIQLYKVYIVSNSHFHSSLLYISGVLFTLRMDASNNKLAMYVVPTQFGKTFACIQTIKASPPDTLHVVFTMNTLIGKDQFTSRVVREIEAAYGTDSVCCVASKKSNVCKRRFKNTDELGDEIALSMMGRKAPIRVVVMCSHGKRFQEAPEFITDVMKIMMGVSPEKRQKLQMYFDEIHHYANGRNPGGRRVRMLIEEACGSEMVKKVYGYTATPNAVWGDGMWESIEIDNVDYNDENYVGVSDLDWVKCQSTGLPAEFAANVYDSHPRVFGHMARVFVPGYRERNTHYAVRDTLQDKDPEIVVIVLNGENKRVYYYENPEDYDHEPKSEELIPEGMEEVCDTIARVITRLNLLERPIVWTGNICVSMGQTLAHESVGAFTSVLINTHAIDSSALYQLLGRATGRYLGWGIDMYPTVYSPIEVKDVCEELEYAAKTLANDFSGQEVTQDLYSSLCPTACPQKRVKTPPPPHTIEEDGPFDTFEDAKRFLKTKETQMKTKPRIGKKTSIFEVDEYKFTSRMNSKETTTLDDRITVDKLKTIAQGMCLSAKKGNTYLIVPVYETYNTPADNEKYYVRYINFE